MHLVLRMVVAMVFANGLGATQGWYVAIGDAGLFEMGRECRLAEIGLARVRCGADIDQGLDAGVFEPGNELRDAEALVA